MSTKWTDIQNRIKTIILLDPYSDGAITVDALGGVESIDVRNVYGLRRFFPEAFPKELQGEERMLTAFVNDAGEWIIK